MNVVLLLKMCDQRSFAFLRKGTKWKPILILKSLKVPLQASLQQSFFLTPTIFNTILMYFDRNIACLVELNPSYISSCSILCAFKKKNEMNGVSNFRNARINGIIENRWSNSALIGVCIFMYVFLSIYEHGDGIVDATFFAYFLVFFLVYTIYNYSWNTVPAIEKFRPEILGSTHTLNFSICPINRNKDQLFHLYVENNWWIMSTCRPGKSWMECFNGQKHFCIA